MPTLRPDQQNHPPLLPHETFFNVGIRRERIYDYRSEILGPKYNVLFRSYE